MRVVVSMMLVGCACSTALAVQAQERPAAASCSGVTCLEDERSAGERPHQSAATTVERGPSSTEPVGYRELVDEALREYGAGNYEEARSLFRRAHSRFPTARSHRGLGMAEYELRNYPSAIEELEAALASNVRPLDEKLRRHAEELLARANGFVGRVLIETRPAATRVTIDGVPVVHRPGQPLVLKLGEHLIEAESEAPTERRRVTLVGGEVETVRIEFRTDRRERERSGSPPLYRNPWLWTAVGLVVAGAATGTALALSGADKASKPSGGTTGVVRTGP